jgi:hypothetical protein
LIPAGAFEAGARKIPIALLIQSVDYTLQNVLFKQVLNDMLKSHQWDLTERATASRTRVSFTVALSRLERTLSTSSEIALEALPGAA